METSPPPRRHWFRFSLRTMLVLVTLLCIYLGWAMNWIRQREAYRKSYDTRRDVVWLHNKTAPAPWCLRILREKGEFCFFNLGAEEAQMIAASRLFPEARIIFYEITRNGLGHRPAKLGIFSVPPILDFPYYQNGVLFREDLLEQVVESD